MKNKKYISGRRWLFLLLALIFGLSGCSDSKPQGDAVHEPGNVIYLAGGCFWGLEQLMQSIPGVIDAQSGYANGTGEEDANYEAVCSGKTGFRETVRVEYDPEEVSLDAILMAYYPGCQGGVAIAETLFGINNPTGLLPIQMPRDMESVRNQESDIAYDLENPLYDYGFGLSYE